MFSPGKQMGPYEIEGLIGAGGMGQVFRGVDTRLGRAVAIKVSYRKFDGRFEREARAIASLNHPHICTLYDVGPDYLVMELVDGETLAARLKRGKLTIDEILRYGAQIASALAEAHRKGVTHRDLKPSNVMLTTHGVKVLDFGLAKLQTAPDDQLTQAGVIMGTPAYMAPEQMEGKPVSEAADLFALGLVLYEMLSGKLPYPGASLASMMIKGAAVDLRPPSRSRRDIPKDLGTIVLGLLKQSPDERIPFAPRLSTVFSELQHPAPRIAIRALAAGFTLVALIGAAWWITARPGQRHGDLVYEQLTDFPDAVNSPALSKDGKKVVFVRGPVTFLSGPGQIYVKDLPSGTPIALTHDADVKLAPTFSPDGQRIVYTSGRGWASMSVPAGGGEPALMLKNAAGLRWIGPHQVLYSAIKSGFHMGLITAYEDGSSPRSVYFPESSDGMVHFSEISPDGKWVLAVEMLNSVWQPCRLVSFDGSASGKVVGPPGALCTAAAWSPDGQWMYFAAETNGDSHLWRQRFPNGGPEQLTKGATQEWGVAVDPDGRSLISSVGKISSAVWYRDQRGERPISVDGYAYRPFIPSSGAKVFYLVRRGVRGSIWSGELWSADVSSGRSEAVSPGVAMQNYAISSDGKAFVFDRFDEAGRSSIWIGTSNRSESPRRLTPGDEDGEDLHPLMGRSGAVYFMKAVGDQRFLYKMSADGSHREELRTANGDYLVNLSPDEKWAVMWNGGKGVSLYPLDRGPARFLCACATGPIFQDSPRVSWSGDGKLLIVNAGGAMAGLGTTVVPWKSAVSRLANSKMNGPELRLLSGARQIGEVSIAMGLTDETYAFTRASSISNLYRIRLP
jgi:Tol biopolymer transport system component/predicted Ser/Thr protein kinase